MANNAVFPPFNIFVDFVKEMSRVKNDPSFMYNGDVTHSIEKQPSNTFKGRVNTKKTTVCQQTDTWTFKECKPEAPVFVIHKGPGVSISDSRVFRLKPIEEEGRYYEEMDSVLNIAPEHTDNQTVRNMLRVKTAEVDNILLRFMWIHCQHLLIEHQH